MSLELLHFNQKEFPLCMNSVTYALLQVWVDISVATPCWSVPGHMCCYTFPSKLLGSLNIHMPLYLVGGLNMCIHISCRGLDMRAPMSFMLLG